MNTTSASRAEAAAGASSAAAILVWDAPVRVVHWLMVLSFAGAWVTAESETWRLLHVTLGYTLAGLAVFRIAWGLVGTRHARFSDFVRGPAAVGRYLRSLWGPRPEHHVGHNPAGALAIVALLLLALGVTASGWALYAELGGDWLEDVHEAAANLMLAVVLVHVAGVAVASWLHRENLLRAMVTGRKPGTPRDAIRSAWRSIAALVLAAALGFWWLQWQQAPSHATGADTPVATSPARHRAEDGD
jgi:cytochrome b